MPLNSKRQALSSSSDTGNDDGSGVVCLSTRRRSRVDRYKDDYYNQQLQQSVSHNANDEFYNFSSYHSTTDINNVQRRRPTVLMQGEVVGTLDRQASAKVVANHIRPPAAKNTAAFSPHQHHHPPHVLQLPAPTTISSSSVSSSAGTTPAGSSSAVAAPSAPNNNSNSNWCSSSSSSHTSGLGSSLGTTAATTPSQPPRTYHQLHQQQQQQQRGGASASSPVHKAAVDSGNSSSEAAAVPTTTPRQKNSVAQLPFLWPPSASSVSYQQNSGASSSYLPATDLDGTCRPSQFGTAVTRSSSTTRIHSNSTTTRHKVSSDSKLKLPKRSASFFSSFCHRVASTCSRQPSEKPASGTSESTSSEIVTIAGAAPSFGTSLQVPLAEEEEETDLVTTTEQTINDSQVTERRPSLAKPSIANSISSSAASTADDSTYAPLLTSSNHAHETSARAQARQHHQGRQQQGVSIQQQQRGGGGTLLMPNGLTSFGGILPIAQTSAPGDQEETTTYRNYNNEINNVNGSSSINVSFANSTLVQNDQNYSHHQITEQQDVDEDVRHYREEESEQQNRLIADGEDDNDIDDEQASEEGNYSKATAEANDVVDCVALPSTREQQQHRNYQQRLRRPQQQNAHNNNSRTKQHHALLPFPPSPPDVGEKPQQYKKSNNYDIEGQDERDSTPSFPIENVDFVDNGDSSAEIQEVVEEAVTKSTATDALLDHSKANEFEVAETDQEAVDSTSPTFQLNEREVSLLYDDHPSSATESLQNEQLSLFAQPESGQNAVINVSSSNEQIVAVDRTETKKAVRNESLLLQSSAPNSPAVDATVIDNSNTTQTLDRSKMLGKRSLSSVGPKSQQQQQREKPLKSVSFLITTTRKSKTSSNAQNVDNDRSEQQQQEQVVVRRPGEDAGSLTGSSSTGSSAEHTPAGSNNNSRSPARGAVPFFSTSSTNSFSALRNFSNAKNRFDRSSSSSDDDPIARLNKLVREDLDADESKSRLAEPANKSGARLLLDAASSVQPPKTDSPRNSFLSSDGAVNRSRSHSSEFSYKNSFSSLSPLITTTTDPNISTNNTVTANSFRNRRADDDLVVGSSKISSSKEATETLKPSDENNEGDIEPKYVHIISNNSTTDAVLSTTVAPRRRASDIGASTNLNEGSLSHTSGPVDGNLYAQVAPRKPPPQLPIVANLRSPSFFSTSSSNIQVPSRIPQPSSSSQVQTPSRSAKQVNNNTTVPTRTASGNSSTGSSADSGLSSSVIAGAAGATAPPPIPPPPAYYLLNSVATKIDDKQQLRPLSPAYSNLPSTSTSEQPNGHQQQQLSPAASISSPSSSPSSLYRALHRLDQKKQTLAAAAGVHPNSTAIYWQNPPANTTSPSKSLTSVHRTRSADNSYNYGDARSKQQNTLYSGDEQRLIRPLESSLRTQSPSSTFFGRTMSASAQQQSGNGAKMVTFNDDGHRVHEYERENDSGLSLKEIAGLEPDTRELDHLFDSLSSQIERKTPPRGSGGLGTSSSSAAADDSFVYSKPHQKQHQHERSSSSPPLLHHTNNPSRNYADTGVVQQQQQPPPIRNPFYQGDLRALGAPERVPVLQPVPQRDRNVPQHQWANEDNNARDAGAELQQLTASLSPPATTRSSKQTAGVQQKTSTTSDDDLSDGVDTAFDHKYERILPQQQQQQSPKNFAFPEVQPSDDQRNASPLPLPTSSHLNNNFPPVQRDIDDPYSAIRGMQPPSSPSITSETGVIQAYMPKDRKGFAKKYGAFTFGLPTQMPQLKPVQSPELRRRSSQPETPDLPIERRPSYGGGVQQSAASQLLRHIDSPSEERTAAVQDQLRRIQQNNNNGGRAPYMRDTSRDISVTTSETQPQLAGEPRVWESQQKPNREPAAREPRTVPQAQQLSSSSSSVPQRRNNGQLNSSSFYNELDADKLVDDLLMGSSARSAPRSAASGGGLSMRQQQDNTPQQSRIRPPNNTTTAAQLHGPQSVQQRVQQAQGPLSSMINGGGNNHDDQDRQIRASAAAIYGRRRQPSPPYQHQEPNTGGLYGDLANTTASDTEFTRVVSARRRQADTHETRGFNKPAVPQRQSSRDMMGSSAEQQSPPQRSTETRPSASTSAQQVRRPRNETESAPEDNAEESRRPRQRPRSNTKIEWSESDAAGSAAPMLTSRSVSREGINLMPRVTATQEITTTTELHGSVQRNELPVTVKIPKKQYYNKPTSSQAVQATIGEVTPLERVPSFQQRSDPSYEARQEQQPRARQDSANDRSQQQKTASSQPRQWQQQSQPVRPTQPQSSPSSRIQPPTTFSSTSRNKPREIETQTNNDFDNDDDARWLSSMSSRLHHKRHAPQEQERTEREQRMMNELRSVQERLDEIPNRERRENELPLSSVLLREAKTPPSARHRVSGEELLEPLLKSERDYTATTPEPPRRNQRNQPEQHEQDSTKYRAPNQYRQQSPYGRINSDNNRRNHYNSNNDSERRVLEQLGATPMHTGRGYASEKQQLSSVQNTVQSYEHPYGRTTKPKDSPPERVSRRDVDQRQQQRYQEPPLAKQRPATSKPRGDERSGQQSRRPNDAGGRILSDTDLSESELSESYYTYKLAPSNSYRERLVKERVSGHRSQSQPGSPGSRRRGILKGGEEFLPTLGNSTGGDNNRARSEERRNRGGGMMNGGTAYGGADDDVQGLVDNLRDDRRFPMQQQNNERGGHGTHMRTMSGASSPTLYHGLSRKSSLQSLNADDDDVISAHPRFVRDVSKWWYKPHISREDTVRVLQRRQTGTFIVRNSNSFPGAYGLAVKVDQIPRGVAIDSRNVDTGSSELVRHFLIEPTSQGVHIKGCENEPVFGSLAALVYQHSLTAMALPVRLLMPQEDPTEGILPATSHSSSRGGAMPQHSDEAGNASSDKNAVALRLLDQGAACNVLYLYRNDTEALTGPQAVEKTIDSMMVTPVIEPTVVHFKVNAQGITLTDNERRFFFRRHYPVASISYCGTDPEDRRWNYQTTASGPITSARLYGFVTRKSFSHQQAGENECLVFAEYEADQPATAICNFISRVMLAKQQQAGDVNNSHYAYM